MHFYYKIIGQSLHYFNPYMSWIFSSCVLGMIK
ncbi:hypothetical protein E2C01_000207 [Portunus trituberculatus]|uniref:Uncharacterized protein n=1 Tax=Portunus trituberculatus TaxID=210409 RepID=A0A5B7CG18_PORTR|nr:hypothetical protein [Portunus trituberculatus]